MTSNPMSITPEALQALLATVLTTIQAVYQPTHPPRIIPTPSTLATALTMLHRSLPRTGLGLSELTTHLISHLLPSLPASSTSPHYYAFVSGGTTPAALLADLLVTATDQNVLLHIPTLSPATELEHVTTQLLAQLFRLDASIFQGRTLTSGATAGNILGLACAREKLIPGASESGMVEACAGAGISGMKVFAAAPHSSLVKAMAVIGVGRGNVVDVAARPGRVDLGRLRVELQEARSTGHVCVVSLAFGEVDTGVFDTGIEEVRRMVDEFGGWVHVDAAFGIFARVLDGQGYAEGLELADSICGDGHKLLNVPYDSGFFFTRHTTALSTFVNRASYLPTPDSPSIPSPLNTGLENSRRFRALPIYATLCAYGSDGYKHLVTRLVTHSRNIARFIDSHPAYELLNGPAGEVFVVVLFSAKDDAVNVVLAERINRSGGMYVSGTVWEGREAVRIAVGNWRVEGDEWGVVREVLETAVAAGDVVDFDGHPLQPSEAVI